MVLVEMPKNEKVEELLDSLAEHLKELKDEASEVRKQGIDLTMVDLMVIDVPSRILLARKTYAQVDIDCVKNLLGKIRHEIDISKGGTEFDDALKKIQVAYEKIRHEKYEDASEIYAELRKVYKNLPEEMRRIIFVASLDIHKKLKQKTG
ncbi:MAG: type I-A CRISPR-associated protein Cas5a [archaeon]|nr:type I-A CRISPR-associated protein Cas5a [archaeon]